MLTSSWLRQASEKHPTEIKIIDSSCRFLLSLKHKSFNSTFNQQSEVLLESSALGWEGGVPCLHSWRVNILWNDYRNKYKKPSNLPAHHNHLLWLKRSKEQQLLMKEFGRRQSWETILPGPSSCFSILEPKQRNDFWGILKRNSKLISCFFLL